MSETPRTDDEEMDGWERTDICVSAEFARTLERELNAASTRIGQLMEETRRLWIKANQQK